ncbi:hypothetical protein ACLBWT_18680 [Paenibacillus sp. D51F]
MVVWLIQILFALGVALVVIPVLASIKIKKRLRLPAARFRRKQNFHDLYQSLIQKENTKKGNYKIARQLKTAGHPYGMQVFHFRLLQMLLPIGIAIVLIGMYCLKSAMNDGYTTSFPLIGFILFVILFYAAPSLLLMFFAHKRREILAYEIVQFSHRLVVCITDKIPLYYAIRRAGRTSKVLKPYVDEMLIDWMDNPREAINRFGDHVGINEVLPVTNTLLASWNAPQDKIIELFHQQIRNIDTMRDFHVKKKIEASPLRVTFVIMIPFIVACILTMLPWYRSFIAIMQQTF